MLNYKLIIKLTVVMTPRCNFRFGRSKKVAFLCVAVCLALFGMGYISLSDHQTIINVGKRRKSSFKNPMTIQEKIQEKEDTFSYYEFTNFSDALEHVRVDFWKSIKPGFTCPKELLTKVGGSGNGLGSPAGKWTCGLTTLGKLSLSSPTDDNQPCIVYSFGVNDDSHFEAEVLGKTGCTIYAYDPFVNRIGNPIDTRNPRVIFQKLGIGGYNNGTTRTLKTLMQLNGHNWIDIVKMDAEMAEYASLDTAMRDFPDFDGNNKSSGLPFGQLLVEVHVWEWHLGENDTVNEEKAKMVVNFFERLEQRGLRMFNLEINPFGGGHCCTEFSFVNVKSASLKRFLGSASD